jgi:hypothetical protein
MQWFPNFSGHCPLGSINSSPVPPALPYKKYSSEQRFAQPAKENKIFDVMDGLDEVIPVSQYLG